MFYVCVRCGNSREDFDWDASNRIRTCNRCRKGKREWQSVKGKERHKVALERYNLTEKGKKSIYIRTKRAWEKNPEKVLARRKVYYAKKIGKIKQEVCFCGNMNTQAHHPDYSKPLQIEWLCNQHHPREEVSGYSLCCQKS